MRLAVVTGVVIGMMLWQPALRTPLLLPRLVLYGLHFLCTLDLVFHFIFVDCRILFQRLGLAELPFLFDRRLLLYGNALAEELSKGGNV